MPVSGNSPVWRPLARWSAAPREPSVSQRDLAPSDRRYNPVALLSEEEGITIQEVFEREPRDPTFAPVLEQRAHDVLDRVFGQARRGDNLQPVHTSEDGRFDIADARGGMSARLPAADVEFCRRDPDCEIVVQLLRYWSPPGAYSCSSGSPWACSGRGCVRCHRRRRCDAPKELRLDGKIRAVHTECRTLSCYTFIEVDDSDVEAVYDEVNGILIGDSQSPGFVRAASGRT